MMLSDEVVAVFQSSFKDGDVRLVYCPHRRVYELRYAVLMRSQSGGRRRLVGLLWRLMRVIIRRWLIC